jgi:hypothetical protein
MYKNWKAICQITDTHFMWALALLDLATDLGRMVVERFPEFFSNEQQAGPIPWSVLITKAKGKANKDCQYPEDNMYSCEVIPDGWPVFKFGDEDTIVGYPELGFEPVPEELKNATKVGSTYTWGEKQIILIEFAQVKGDEWHFVPAELIVVDK